MSARKNSQILNLQPSVKAIRYVVAKSGMKDKIQRKKKNEKKNDILAKKFLTFWEVGDIIWKLSARAAGCTL